LFPKEDRPGSSGVESRARTEQIREICFESGKSVMKLFQPRRNDVRGHAVPAAAI